MGVHIAHVTQFLRPDTPMDLEAMSWTTSHPTSFPIIQRHRELPNGNFEVGVHIADVTHFLRPDTPMDLEAMSRATSVYLVQRRIDMLPKPLTEDICSLRCVGNGWKCGGPGKQV